MGIFKLRAKHFFPPSSEHLLCLPAKRSFRSLIPVGQSKTLVGSDHRVIDAVDQLCLERVLLLHQLPLADVDHGASDPLLRPGALPGDHPLNADKRKRLAVPDQLHFTGLFCTTGTRPATEFVEFQEPVFGNTVLEPTFDEVVSLLSQKLCARVIYFEDFTVGVDCKECDGGQLKKIPVLLPFIPGLHKGPLQFLVLYFELHLMHLKLMKQSINPRIVFAPNHISLLS